MSTVGHESRHKEHMAMLKEHAVRVVEILIDWDEDNNGKTDRGEFLKALPVLNISATKAEGKALFDSLSAGARQVEHWELFRRLVAAPGVDLIAAEDSARRQLAIAKTMSKTAVLSPFWQRETGGKSVNRHALRKRTVALQPWERHNKGTGNEWTSGLRSMSAFQADSEVESVNARQLQGIILNTDAPVQQQLLAALDQHLARVIELFRAWDEDGDGNVTKREFRRGLKLFGLAATNEEIDELFDDFDRSGDGLVQFRELSRMIKRAAAEKRARDSQNRLPPVDHRSPRSAAKTSPRRSRHANYPHLSPPSDWASSSRSSIRSPRTRGISSASPSFARRMHDTAIFRPSVSPSPPPSPTSVTEASILQTVSPRMAMRHLQRVTKLDSAAAPTARARVRLNLSCAQAREGQFYEAAETAKDAEIMLRDAAQDANSSRSSDETKDLNILRALALHQLCVTHEHLGQKITALKEVRRGYKLARSVLPEDDALVTRLVAIERSLSVYDKEQQRPKTSPA